MCNVPAPRPPGRAMCPVSRNRRQGVRGLSCVTGDCPLKKWGIKKGQGPGRSHMSHGIEATSYLQHPLVSIPQASLALLPGLPSLSAPLFVPTSQFHQQCCPMAVFFFQGSSLVLGGGVCAGLEQSWGRDLEECSPPPPQHPVRAVCIIEYISPHYSALPL